MSTSHSLNKDANVAVTQGAGVTGKLATALTGSGTSIAVIVPTGTTIVTGTNLVVGGTAVAHTIIDSAVVSRAGNMYTFTITSQTINQVRGASVYQGATPGRLRVACAGAVTSVVIVSLAGLTFDTTTNLIIGEGGTAYTVAGGTISAVASSGGLNGPADYLELELVRFMQGAIFNAAGLIMSGDLTNSAGDFLVTESADQLFTKSGSGNLLISGSAKACVDHWCFNAGAVTQLSSVDLTIDASSAAAEKFHCTENVCKHLNDNSFLQIEIVKLFRLCLLFYGVRPFRQTQTRQTMRRACVDSVRLRRACVDSFQPMAGKYVFVVIGRKRLTGWCLRKGSFYTVLL